MNGFFPQAVPMAVRPNSLARPAPPQSNPPLAPPPVGFPQAVAPSESGPPSFPPRPLDVELAKRNAAQDLLTKFMKQDPTKTQVKRPREEEPVPSRNEIASQQESDNSHLAGMHPSRRRRILEGGRVDVPGNYPAPQHQQSIPPQYQRVVPPSPQYQRYVPPSPQNQQHRSNSHHMNSHSNTSQQAHAPTINRHRPRPPLSENPHIMAGAGKFNSAVVPIPPEIFQPPPWLGRASKKYCFEVFAGKELVNRFPIWNDKILVIGRQPDCNIVVNHVLVSRRHAIILFHEDNGELMVYDVGSTHGTFLNDMSGKIPVNDGLLPRKQFIPVRLGWRIMFGKCAYQYSLVSDGVNHNWAPPRAPPSLHGSLSQGDNLPKQHDQRPPPLTGIARFLQRSSAARGAFNTTTG